MAAALSMSPSPMFTNVGGRPLPRAVDDVMKEIQKCMMDDKSNSGGRQWTIPNMPREFVCSEVLDDEKRTMLDLAGEDKRRDVPDPECYEIGVPFLMKRIPRNNQAPLFLWSSNVISFKNSSSSFAVADIRRVVVPVKDRFTGERKLKLFDISTDTIAELTYKPLKEFLKSSLVQKQTESSYLISSHYMTITWLRSRLDKALNKYREVEKNVEVIATIKQKDGGPLFLRLQVEEKTRSGRLIEHDFLFSFFPAFRVTQCQLIVPVFSLMLDTATRAAFESENHYLWEVRTLCGNLNHTHKIANCMDGSYMSQISKVPSGVSGSLAKAATEEKKAYKESIKRQTREMTPSQRRQCIQCKDPVSRMLLEYYYQYGHIPDDEMFQTRSYVWEILQFLKNGIQEDCKHNEPRVLEFMESGSVSEKLKVVQPDEFDIMIRIDLPDSTDCYTFIEDPSFPTGYAICKIRPSNSFNNSLKRCLSKSDKFGHCLAPEQLAFGWLHGKLQQAINKYNKKTSSQADLKLRRGGPALLLEIRPPNTSMPELPRKISVDLVLALKLGDDDSRYAVAKRAKEEHLYKKLAKEMQTRQDDSGQQVTTNQGRDLARKNLKYLWRISYSVQEKSYLNFVRETQEEYSVDGCQNICLMILKTICTREILKQEDSVICHKLSSYILKTALFHVLAKTDLIQDWQMDCLADRYVDLLDKLSEWKELPHFFFNNAANLRKVFPDDNWCETTATKNLLDELHNTLKIQLLNRFGHIASTFKICKKVMDEKYMQFNRSSMEYFDYSTFLAGVLGNATPEEVIHQPFDKSARPDEKNKKKLVAGQAQDRQITKAAKVERISGHSSDPVRNLQRTEKDEKKSEDRQKQATARRRIQHSNDSLFSPSDVSFDTLMRRFLQSQ